MLVLARRIGEEVSIASGLIRAKVISINGSIVRLGFDAPRDIRIERPEVRDEEGSVVAPGGSRKN